MSDNKRTDGSVGTLLHGQFGRSFIVRIEKVRNTQFHSQSTLLKFLISIKTTFFEIKASAPAGYVLRIEQAIGHCDGNKAKTELFRITHTNSEGIVTEEKYQKMFKNGTIVTLNH